MIFMRHAHLQRPNGLRTSVRGPVAATQCRGSAHSTQAGCELEEEESVQQRLTGHSSLERNTCVRGSSANCRAGSSMLAHDTGLKERVVPEPPPNNDGNGRVYHPSTCRAGAAAALYRQNVPVRALAQLHGSACDQLSRRTSGTARGATHRSVCHTSASRSSGSAGLRRGLRCSRVPRSRAVTLVARPPPRGSMRTRRSLIWRVRSAP
jgi:hypothetical protein